MGQNGFSAADFPKPDRLLDPASDHTHRIQALDPYSDIKFFGNHNKDSAQIFIHSTNQYLTPGTHDHLQGLGATLFFCPSSVSASSVLMLVKASGRFEKSTLTLFCCASHRTTLRLPSSI